MENRIKVWALSRHQCGATECVENTATCKQCFYCHHHLVTCLRRSILQPLLWTQTEFVSLDGSSSLAFPRINCIENALIEQVKAGPKRVGCSDYYRKRVFHFFSISPVLRSNCKTSPCHLIKFKRMKWAVKLEKYICTLNYVANGSLCFLSFVQLIGWRLL